MPRRKPDEIVEHRVTLGPYERHRLDTYILFNNINKVANPLVNLLSDVSGLAALVGILEAVGVLNIRKYIKANTPLELWYNQVIEGLYSGFDEANQALDAVLAEMAELGQTIEDFDIPDIPGGRDIGETIATESGEFVIGLITGTAKGATAPVLRLWAWGKTTLQNAPPAPSWVPQWPSGRWST
jgi:hypothetical protein